MEVVIKMLLDFANENQKIAAIVMVIGGFRMILKPLVVGIEAFIKESESKKDDEVLEKVKSNVLYKALTFLVDYAFSIKIKK